MTDYDRMLDDIFGPGDHDRRANDIRREQAQIAADAARNLNDLDEDLDEIEEERARQQRDRARAGRIVTDCHDPPPAPADGNDQGDNQGDGTPPAPADGQLPPPPPPVPGDQPNDPPAPTRAQQAVRRVTPRDWTWVEYVCGVAAWLFIVVIGFQLGDRTDHWVAEDVFKLTDGFWYSFVIFGWWIVLSLVVFYAGGFLGSFVRRSLDDRQYAPANPPAADQPQANA